MGGFQLIDFIVTEIKKSHDLLKLNSSHWLKLQHSEWRANLVKDFIEEKKNSTNAMRALKFLTGHMIYNLAYT